MRVSVVIVNYNGRHLLRDCLEGLRVQTRAVDELIVVDNGSGDGSVQLLGREFPEACLIETGTNLGFAGGNNIGIRASTGEIVVLLNNDTIPSPAFIEEVTAPLEEDRALSAVAGIMLFATRAERVATSGIDVYEDGLALDRDVGTDWRQLPRSFDVFGPSGGAAAYRRVALNDVGLFPEPYFLYLEDADLAWRLRLRGHTTIANSGAWALHIYSASAGENSPLKDYYLARNRAWLLIRCWPDAVWRQNWWPVLRYEFSALGYAVLTGRWSSIHGRIAGWSAFLRVGRSRHRIQSRMTSDAGELLYWFRSSSTVRNVLRARRVVHSLTRHGRGNNVS